MRSDRGQSVESSRKVLDEFLRDEISAYADAELERGTASRKGGERAERLRDTAENPGIRGFTSGYAKAETPSSDSEERGEVAPSPALYVKAAAQAWPFERGTEETKGQRGVILAPMKNDNSPKVSFSNDDELTISTTAEENSTESTGDDAGAEKWSGIGRIESTGDDAGAEKWSGSGRIEDELRSDRATVKDMTKWLLSGKKEVHSNYARPVVKYEGE